jgi:hypothetical protein
VIRLSYANLAASATIAAPGDDVSALRGAAPMLPAGRNPGPGVALGRRVGREPNPMPTYQMTCDRCGEDRWPMLPERPARYTCVRCLATPLAVHARRAIATTKRQETRQRKATARADA